MAKAYECPAEAASQLLIFSSDSLALKACSNRRWIDLERSHDDALVLYVMVM